MNSQTKAPTQRLESAMLVQILQQHVGIVELTPAGGILHANEHFLSMFGYTLPHLRKMRHEALYASDCAVSVDYEKLWNKILGNDRTVHVALCQRDNGSSFWLRATYHLLRNANGKAELVVGLCDDVSELMAETQANAMQLASVDCTLLAASISPSGDCLSANENCLNTLGLTWQELAGRNILDIFGSLLTPEEHEKIKSCLRMGGSYSLRLRWPRFDGAVVQLDVWLLPLRKDGKEIHKIMLLAADMTARLGYDRKKMVRYRHLAEAVDRSRNAIVITDGGFKALYANAAFSDIFGYARKIMVGTSPTSVFGANEKRILDEIRTGLSSATSLRLEEAAYGKFGQKMWFSLWVSTFTDQYDHNKRIILTFTDITNTKLCEVLQHTALEAMAHELSVLELFPLLRREVENFIPGLHVVGLKMDDHGELRGISYSRAERDVEALHRVISLTDTPIYDALKRRSTVTVQDISKSSYPQYVKDAYAALRIGAVLVQPVYSGKNELFGMVVFLYNTVTEQNNFHLRVAGVIAEICAIAVKWSETRKALLMFTHYNSVTGLPNLNTLATAVEQEMLARRLHNNEVASVAALCINIERFRRINKTWGAKASNETLKIVAQRLSEVKGPDDLLAHAFEDEFVMVSMGCDEAQAWETGKRVQAALAVPLLINDIEVVLSANIGVSMSREGEISVGEPSRMIEEARTALFQMKRGERAQIHFYGELPDSFSGEDISLEARLMRAIEEGKLHLCYQPQVSLQNGEVYGVEALCRWQEEDLGDIAPGKFIALAEEAGLIGKLTDWVLREVCRQLDDWRKRNVPVPAVAVNLSALNFHETDLPDKILRYLEEYSLEPQDLMLELTETTLLDNDPSTLNTLHRAKSRGFTLSLDDFGTGYSSLSYLRNLPISEMKLDRSFVQDLHENDVSQRLSKAIIRVGESLNLCVLAEGVENKQQLDVLKKHHYHVVQGHFLSKPLLPEELEIWLGAWEPSKIFA